MLYQLSYTPAIRAGMPTNGRPTHWMLTGLLVIRVLVAPRAELFELHAIRMETLVFLDSIAPHLAVIASEDDDVPHET
jgi:hypothetical protein